MLLSEIARQRMIRYFLISYVDLFGALRAKLVPAQAIDKMAAEGAGFAGFATWLDMTPADPDVMALPDPSSLIQLPWKPEVGWLAADPYMGGKLVEQAPRNVLKRLLASDTREMKTGVECEFFLVAPDGSVIGDVGDRAQKPCYDQSALMRRYDVIAEICDAMLGTGLGAVSERPRGRERAVRDELGVRAGRCRRRTGTCSSSTWSRAIAEKHGLRATFMPKPFIDLTGSGCHAHVSLWEGERNLFADQDGELGVSGAGYAFVGGVLGNAEALCALTNPSVNSYKRINAPATTSGATWAPNTISYGGNNRTHMVRIPDGGRFEFRLADGAANPYLLQAGLLAAGLDGMAKGTDPGTRLDINMYTHGHTVAGVRRLPLNLLDALRALDGSSVLRERLGAAFVDSYIKLKTADWNAYARHLTAWERDTTLDC